MSACVFNAVSLVLFFEQHFKFCSMNCNSKGATLFAVVYGITGLNYLMLQKVWGQKISLALQNLTW
jgi:hypothetical protein